MLCCAVGVSGEAEAYGRTESMQDTGFRLRNSTAGLLADWGCAMSAAAAILPMVWAMEALPVVLREPAPVQEVVSPEMAFYRKYTEGILRRYVRMSMEVGKVPSLLGREMFRAKVTGYRVEGFDDAVIFVHDVEKCLEKLEEEQRRLIVRIALQQYTILETAELMRLKPKTVVRRYRQAIDRLTRVFLAVEMLEPQNAVKGVFDPNFA